VILQQRPGAQSYTRNRHRVVTTPLRDWDNCCEEGDSKVAWKNEFSPITVGTLGHPAQSLNDSNVPLQVKTQHDAADRHLNTWLFQQVEQAFSLIKGHGSKNFCNNKFGKDRHVERLWRNGTL